MYYGLLSYTYIVCVIVFSCAPLSFGKENVHNFGQSMEMTYGEVWPKPMLQNTYDGYLKLEPEHFQFNITNYSCDGLQEAIKRYTGLLFLKATKISKRKNIINKFSVLGTLGELNVHLANPCEDYPPSNMDEKYELNLKYSSGILSALSIWGILRGLETFSQLITLASDGSTFVVRCTSIIDYPKFSYRGFLLDTSRHYIPIQSILETLDAMAYSKLNVFHWHIVDDQSFPFQSSVFPNLSAKGAYGPSAIYTRIDVKLVIEYAKLRGIRVIPEFDTPGHTLSWRDGSGVPSLLTQCSDDDPKLFGPIDPTVEENYCFIKTLLTEISGLFKDEYLHLGGDEVNMTCWSTNKKIQEFMLKNNMSTIKQLQNYYFENIFHITRNIKTVPVVWEEVFDENIDLDSNVVVQVWKDNYTLTISKVLKSGHRVLLSSCWYLNYISYGSDWLSFYKCDPNKIGGQNNLFLGGEACMWGEYVDETNLLPRSWPRTSAVAEVLWSHELNETEAIHRFEEHVCRMRRRGIPAQPANGPSYCSY